jgi:hypothetical protein
MHAEQLPLPCQVSPRQTRLLRLAASMLVTAMAVACTSAAPPRNSPGRDFAQYRTLPHYRAFAVTGGTLDAVNYASGWSEEKASVEAAVDEALSECNRFRDAASQPACQLYAIGDLVVAGTDAAQLPRAKCAYVLSATTVPTAGPNAAACAELLSATLAPAPAVAGEPAANPSTATPLPAASALSAGQSTPSAPIPSPIASSPAVPEPDAEPTWPYRALVDVRVRQGPGNDYPIVGTLVRHAKVGVIGKWQGWLRIRLDDGQIGFVYGRWLVEAAE